MLSLKDIVKKIAAATGDDPVVVRRVLGTYLTALQNSLVLHRAVELPKVGLLSVSQSKRTPNPVFPQKTPISHRGYWMLNKILLRRLKTPKEVSRG